jgi:hypothetical protein
VTRSKSLDLTLTTKDGDTVTISSSFSLTEMAAAAKDGDSSVSAMLRTASSSLSIDIQGSLDREERADLQKALKLLAKAARRNDAGMLQRRLAGADFGSVASFSASMQGAVQVISGKLTVA